MRLSDPIPWRDVPVGAIVADPRALPAHVVPREVLIAPGPTGDLVWLAGADTPRYVGHGTAYRGAHLVELDDGDALANLQRGGFTTEILYITDGNEGNRS